MILDFRIFDGASDVECDLCIIGAGAAGITLARELISTNAEVCLLESGGLEFEDDVQGLYRGEIRGHPYVDLDVTRLRMFGGSTNHWTGACVPLNDIDFRERSWVPHSGWPIAREDLAPYYRRAQPLLELSDFLYDEAAWQIRGVKPLAFSKDKLIDRFWQKSPPTNFGVLYRSELEAATNIKVMLHATVLEVGAYYNASKVDYVEIRTVEGKSGRVRAKFFVLACGGIENARILLLSDTIEQYGLGNRNDLVGRFFMEHPHADAAVVYARAPEELADRYIGFYQGGVKFRAGICAADALQEKKQILNASASVFFLHDPESGVKAAKDIVRSYRKGEFPDDMGDKLWRIARDIDDIVSDGYRYLIEGLDPVGSLKEIYLFVRSEQAPNSESRVGLSNERDRLGKRRAYLDWRLTEMDKKTIALLLTTIGGELARLDVARVQLRDWLLNDGSQWSEKVSGGNHHMGTTRMADDPRRGVVDNNCRVHGVENLYIAGSSVFPTGGYANPTLTIVALTLRLADHLKAKLS